MDAAEKFLNVGTRPASLKNNTWYAFKPAGDAPTARVGHTATYIAEEQIVVFIGGAIPDSLCDDLWILQLSDSTCSKVITKGDFEYRYEHCAFDATLHAGPAEENPQTKIWIFAGANMQENKNDVWEFDVVKLEWNRVRTQGDVPSQRTLHSSAGHVKRLLVFGGGSLGAEAVKDLNIHQLDINKRAWSILETTGDPPAPRHGHIMVTDSDNKMYVHGGLNGTTFFDDLYILESNGTWTKPKVSEIKPKGRASHGGIMYGGFIYILGGWTDEGVASDFWRIDIKSFVWEQITSNNPSCPARLDFAMTLVQLPEKFFLGQSRTEDFEDVNSVEEYLNLNLNVSSQISNEGDRNRVLLPFIMIHGGMDDKGMIYGDFFVFKLDPKNA